MLGSLPNEATNNCTGQTYLFSNFCHVSANWRPRPHDRSPMPIKGRAQTSLVYYKQTNKQNKHKFPIIPTVPTTIIYSYLKICWRLQSKRCPLSRPCLWWFCSLRRRTWCKLMNVLLGGTYFSTHKGPSVLMPSSSWHRRLAASTTLSPFLG